MSGRHPSEAAIAAEMKNTGFSRIIAIRRIQDREKLFGDLAGHAAVKASVPGWRR